jgi:hypothetical protein
MGEMLGKIESILGSPIDELDENEPEETTEEETIEEEEETIEEESVEENNNINRDIDLGRMQSLLNGFNN